MLGEIDRTGRWIPHAPRLTHVHWRFPTLKTYTGYSGHGVGRISGSLQGGLTVECVVSNSHQPAAHTATPTNVFYAAATAAPTTATVAPTAVPTTTPIVALPDRRARHIVRAAA
jgi:hypothetical protein